MDLAERATKHLHGKPNGKRSTSASIQIGMRGIRWMQNVCVGIWDIGHIYNNDLPLWEPGKTYEGCYTIQRVVWVRLIWLRPNGFRNMGLAGRVIMRVLTRHSDIRLYIIAESCEFRASWKERSQWNTSYDNARPGESLSDYTQKYNTLWNCFASKGNRFST